MPISELEEAKIRPENLYSDPIYNIDYRNEDRNGGKAHITISSSSVESPIHSNEVFKETKKEV
eukprot:CAMPEP_0176341752 /NCGR_PEP_ID=MMETSP0126-20121128/2631_1 /TAXON_ID=141414 ORGANISM="Strombidinopsis acuminatum, Strain SPMC142" /NCGR_SAMPLE_ID=MMETSP0126 /ASSEMBLY_ACC=CAM_ASM_000229 /LENGTH=62 /DNA_ID=CAMNT_0017686761 /DNA_START=2366 /DNA_END=2554 /DNA_ORIENTATION=-